MARRGERAVRAIIAAAALTASVTDSAPAQNVARVQGGGSSGSGGYGAALNYWTADRGAGWIGLGFRDGLHLGFLSQLPVGNDSLSAGHDVQPLPLATDRSGGTNIVTQGLTWRRDVRGSGWTAFLGAAGLGAGAPYVSTTRSERGLAFARVDQRLTTSLRLVGLVAASRRQTLLPGLIWRAPRSTSTVAMSGGVGANEPYASLRWTHESRRLRVDASWSEFSTAFQRIDAPAGVVAESYRENVSVSYDLHRRVRVNAARESYLVPATATTPARRALVDRMMAGGEIGTGSYSVGLFDSHADGVHSLSTYSRVDAGSQRRIGGALAYYSTSTPGHPRQQAVSAEVRERPSLTTELLQVLTHSSSGTSLSAGGRLQAGPVAVSVDYTTLYVPLRVPDPFLRAVTLGLSLGMGRYATSVSTAVDPNGALSYSAAGSTYLYGGVTLMAQPAVMRLESFVVRGVVRDSSGAPFEGAALRVGEQLLFSNSRGEFLLRTSSDMPLALSIAFGDFLVPGNFELASAPERVTPASDGRAEAVVVVLRRMRGRPKER